MAAGQRALTAHGFRVRLARTGKEALELVKDTLPECGVIDLACPICRAGTSAAR
jgi:ActR/RegA family two-component response regulator